jgi:REP element-mobilizing transposase RayT
MANTYSKLYIHFVIVVQNRTSLINKSWKNDLYKYISGIIHKNGHRLMAINGVEDHLHLFVSMSPKQTVSDLMRDVKRSSSLWINENKLVVGRFSWQEGFGAFSYSKSQLDTVVKYIENQEEHHKKSTFREEYLKILEKFDVEYDERYIFVEIDT